MYVKRLNPKYIITIIIDSEQMSCSTTTSSKATTHNTQTKLKGSTSTLQLRGRQQCVDNEAIEAVDKERQERVKRLHCRNDDRPATIRRVDEEQHHYKNRQLHYHYNDGRNNDGRQHCYDDDKEQRHCHKRHDTAKHRIAKETRTGTDIAAATREGSIAKPTAGATIANATTMPGINNAATMMGTAIAATAMSGSVAKMRTTEKHDSRQTMEGNNEVSIMFGMFFF